MLGGVIVFATYSGVLGGAERVLLDCVTRLESPLRVACPPGPLADALIDERHQRQQQQRRDRPRDPFAPTPYGWRNTLDTER